MGKYDSLWEYVKASGKEELELSFDQISCIAGIPLNHSFLSYKKELLDYGYEVGTISLKREMVQFRRLPQAVARQ